MLFSGDFTPTTFDLAFFMHTLFRDEVEREARAIEEARAADYREFLSEEAAKPAAPSPQTEPVDARTPAPDATRRARVHPDRGPAPDGRGRRRTRTRHRLPPARRCRSRARQLGRAPRPRRTRVRAPRSRCRATSRPGPRARRVQA